MDATAQRAVAAIVTVADCGIRMADSTITQAETFFNPQSAVRNSQTKMAMEEKDQDDVVQRLLELGGDKKFLSFDDLNRELPDNVVSPDDIEDVLSKLEGSNITVADSDERLIEQAAAVVVIDEEDALDEELELDLGAGALE